MKPFLLCALSCALAAAGGFAFYEIGRAFSRAPSLRRGRDIAIVLASFLLIASLVVLP